MQNIFFFFQRAHLPDTQPSHHLPVLQLVTSSINDQIYFGDIKKQNENVFSSIIRDNQVEQFANHRPLMDYSCSGCISVQRYQSKDSMMACWSALLPHWILGLKPLSSHRCTVRLSYKVRSKLYSIILRNLVSTRENT